MPTADTHRLSHPNEVFATMPSHFSTSVRRFKPAALLVLAAFGAVPAAQAADIDVYAQVGVPGLSLGLSHRYSENLAMRVDVSTIGSISRNGVQEGVDYQGTAKANRLGVFGDWFVFGGSFRLTGGVTFNDAGATLTAKGAGKQLTVGNTTVTTDATDHFDVAVKFPSVTPYLGLGWGHHQPDGKGFLFDLGASMGKATVTETHGGTNLSQISQADYDRELAQLRDGAAKMPFLPQLTLGFTYRF